jgi:hypothetical protein
MIVREFGVAECCVGCQGAGLVYPRKKLARTPSLVQECRDLRRQHRLIIIKRCDADWLIFAIACTSRHTFKELKVLHVIDKAKFSWL